MRRVDREGMEVDEGWDANRDVVEEGGMDVVEEAAVERAVCEEAGGADGCVPGDDVGGGGSGIFEVTSARRGAPLR